LCTEFPKFWAPLKNPGPVPKVPLDPPLNGPDYNTEK